MVDSKKKLAIPEEDGNTTILESTEALRKVLAEAPLVHEVLAHPEHYEKWYLKSREVLNG